MYNRGTMICLSVTGISALLLFFYFKNKISQVEDKLDTMFNLIQEYNNPSNSRMNPEFIVQEAGTSQQNPIISEENKGLIVVSSESENESEDESEEESEEENEEDIKSNEEEIELNLSNKNNDDVENNVDNTDNKDVVEKENSDDNNSDEDSEDSDEDEDSDDSDEDDEEEGKKENDTEQDLGEKNDDEEKIKNITLEEVPDYKSLTVATLKDLCRDKGLRGYRSLRKGDLVSLLETSH